MVVFLLENGANTRIENCKRMVPNGITTNIKIIKILSDHDYKMEQELLKKKVAKRMRESQQNIDELNQYNSQMVNLKSPPNANLAPAQPVIEPSNNLRTFQSNPIDKNRSAYTLKSVAGSTLEKKKKKKKKRKDRERERAEREMERERQRRLQAKGKNFVSMNMDNNDNFKSDIRKPMSPRKKGTVSEAESYGLQNRDFNAYQNSQNQHFPPLQ